MGHRARSVIVAAVMLAAACSEAGPSSQETRRPSPDVTFSATEPAPSERTSGRPPAVDRRCPERQAKAVENLSWRLSQAGFRLVNSSGSSPTASASLAFHLRTALSNLHTDCNRVPLSARRFLDAGLRATARPLDTPTLRRLLMRFAPWADGITRDDAGTALIRAERTCRRIRTLVTAGHTVWWDHTPEGRDWWIQIVVDNNTDEELDVILNGSVWADGVPARYSDPHSRGTHGGREAVQYSWGGSSADEIYVQPHQRIKKFVGIGEFYKVHLLPTGSFFDVRPELYVSPLSGRGWEGCALPVPRLN